MYWTRPWAFRGAFAMSAITAFFGSLGSTNPVTVPRIFSYWPTAPNDVPPNVGFWTVVIWIFVTSACAMPGAADATSARAANAVPILFSACFTGISFSRRPPTRPAGEVNAAAVTRGSR